MFAAVLAVLLWSTQATAFKLTLRYTNPYGLISIASISSLLVFLLALAASRKLRQITDVKKHLSSALLGFLNPFLYYIVLFNAYNLLKAQEALILNYLWPIVLTLMSVVFLKKPFTFAKLIALVLSFTGAFITITQGNLRTLSFKNPAGITLAIFSTFIWALYWLLNMKDQREDLPKLFYNFLFGNVYLLIFMLVSHPIRISSALAFLGGIYVGLFEMGVTFLLWLKALNSIKDTARVSNLIYFSPFLSLVFISLILKEKIYTSTMVGLALIITGILLQEYLHTKRSLKNVANPNAN